MWDIMRQPGEGLPSKHETSEYLSSLMSELHYSAFCALVEDRDPVISWASADGSANYIATNLDGFDAYRKERSLENAHRVVSRHWEIMRFTDSATKPSTRDLTSYVVTTKDHGLKLDVLTSSGMPKNPNDVQGIVQWRNSEPKNRERQYRLGITEPTDMDYAMLENAMRDLKELNETYFPERFAFDILERRERHVTNKE
jgi:hypothetical protein